MELSLLVGILAVVAQTDAVREYKEHSNNLNKYQIVSVECEGGLNDSGYSIPIKQKVYLKIKKQQTPKKPKCNPEIRR